MRTGCISDRCRVCRSNRCAPALDVNLDSDSDSDIHGRTPIEYQSDNRITHHPGAKNVHHNHRACDDDVNRTTDDHAARNRPADHHPTCAINDSRADDSRLDDGATTVRAGHCAEGSYDVEAGGVQLRRRIRLWSYGRNS
jgi:hypothetical protein